MKNLAPGELEAIRKRSHEEAERCRASLGAAVRSSAVPAETVAARVGLSATALAELLRPNGSTLRYVDMLEILDVVEVSPAAFFAGVFGGPRCAARPP